MNAITGEWVGKITGTNTGDVFLEIRETAGSLSGTVQINDSIFGAHECSLAGKRTGSNITLKLTPTSENGALIKTNVHVGGQPIEVQVPRVHFGIVTVNGSISEAGLIEGKWHSSIGTAGIFFASRAKLETSVKDTQPERQIKEQTFIMMGISKDNLELEDCLGAIKRASNSHGIKAIRIDEIEHSGKITPLILHYIEESRFLVCDITTERPNVYYELGYAHGIGREVILVAKEGTKAHFDIVDYNIIFYQSYSDLEARLKKRMEDLLKKIRIP